MPSEDLHRGRHQSVVPVTSSDPDEHSPLIKERGTVQLYKVLEK